MSIIIVILFVFVMVIVINIAIIGIFYFLLCFYVSLLMLLLQSLFPIAINVIFTICIAMIIVKFVIIFFKQSISIFNCKQIFSISEYLQKKHTHFILSQNMYRLNYLIVFSAKIFFFNVSYYGQMMADKFHMFVYLIVFIAKHCSHASLLFLFVEHA